MPFPEVFIPGLPQLRPYAEQPQLLKEGHIHILIVELTRTTECCHSCGKKLSRSGWQEATLFDLPRGSKPSQLQIRWQRLRCPEKCLQPHALLDIQAQLQVKPEGRQRGAALTKRLSQTLLQRHLYGETVPSLARWSGLKEDTLWGLLAQEIKSLRAQPRDISDWQHLSHIGIDEIFWGEEILCVIMNLATGKLIDILPNRKVNTVVSALQELRQAVRSLGVAEWSPVIVMDMWNDYWQAALFTFGPEAKVVTDRFHLQAKISQDLHDEITAVLQAAGISFQTRQWLTSQIKQTYFAALRHKKMPRPLQASSKGLQRLPLPVIEQLSWTLQMAYKLSLVWEAPNRKAAQQLYNQWSWEVELRHFPQPGPFRRLRYLFELRRKDIFALYDYPLAQGNKPTSGRVEALNGRLRHMMQRSRAHSRDSFAGVDGDDKAQAHYERLRLRALAVTGGILPEPLPKIFTSVWRPEVKACSCGKQPDEQDITWSTQAHFSDLPLAQRPVKGEAQTGRWTCPDCGEQHALMVTQRGATTALKGYVIERRLSGASWDTLHKETGLSHKLLQDTIPSIPQPTQKALPGIIGLLGWYWRKKTYLVITDPTKGNVLEILPLRSPNVLRQFLQSRKEKVQTVLLESPELARFLPSVQTALDAMSTKRLVQPALREVQRQYTNAIPVPTRRTPMYQRHRRLILKRSDRLQWPERQRLQSILATSEELKTAYQLLQEFHSFYPDHWNSNFRQWKNKIHALRERYGVYPSDNLPRSLVYGFRDALRQLENQLDAIQRGIALQQQGINLASSRQVLSQLKGLEAARQPSFGLLRFVALETLKQ